LLGFTTIYYRRENDDDRAPSIAKTYRGARRHASNLARNRSGYTDVVIVNHPIIRGKSISRDRVSIGRASERQSPNTKRERKNREGGKTNRADDV